MYQQNFDQLAWEAAKYDLMSQYYKYSDPQMHIYYYQKHLECMQRMMNDNKNNRIGMNGEAEVRVLHASPDAPDVDVYVNGQPMLEGFSYKQRSNYVTVPAGQYQIDIYPAGQTNQPVLSQMVEVGAGNKYTVAAAGPVSSLQLIAVIDSDSVSSGKAKVRFWHLSPNAPAVDIAVKGGEVLFRNVPFGKATRYLSLPPTTTDLEVRVAGTPNVVLTIPDATLNPNQAYTAVALGFVGEQPPLEAIFIKP
ncbi:DUF4397 domain-containing protein [Halobacillus sp. Marseille-Q1614]|uniref:DUF4397 domain-containing protein n=1 Tax=Halobacillus sp. Marseille-Q1614 TaxID=2709134 RepID=UPI00156ED366|nr:DUF4397 domain-containing protein [Halobacillus sp. Marseille-Q1614]